MTERLCSNCRHYDPPKWRDRAPGMCDAMAGEQHPVTGESMNDAAIHAEMMRMTLCGWRDPKFWEPRK